MMPTMMAAAPTQMAVSEKQPENLQKEVIETGHTDMIHDAQWDYYGRRLATCSSDGTTRIFDITAGERKMEAEIRGHDGPVWQVAWAHPRFGNLIATCGFDHKVILWKEPSKGTWQKVYEFTEHKASVNAVAFGPFEYGLCFACASSDGFVSICTQQKDGNWQESRIVDQEGGGETTHAVGANSVSWAPSANPGGLWNTQKGEAPVRKLVTGGCDNLVKIWKFNEGTNSWVPDGKPLERHTDWVRSVAWAPSIGLASSTIASCGQDKRVVLWTRDDTDNEWHPVELSQFAAPVWSVSWSLTGNILGVASGNDEVTLWKEELDGSWKNITEIMDSGVSAVS
uniref:Protein SEC13 homolog n=1 Tax=Rhodosorus marinus TaxID=101924 RepID=A0A7S0G7X6_9RHOD|mmetsp:Transcript_4989/g.6970  ORF Transcript_4989/g.6970 Transcript_4989/m.6970 type:complete len:340 (+) Transcript_4989:195-1214(+)